MSDTSHYCRNCDSEQFKNGRCITCGEDEPTPPDRESGAIPLPKKLEYRNFEIYPDGGEIGLNLPQLDAMYREMFRRYNAFVALESRAIRAEGALGWHDASKVLPPDRKYVIAKHTRGTWFDKDDQENVNTVIVKLVRGISMAEREALPDSDRRKRLYYGEDEDGNNRVPYRWQSFGPDSFFGQDISHWREIEPALLGTVKS